MPKRTPSTLSKRIQALPDDVRDRVVERAAILWESGVGDEEADRVAYEMETGQASPGLARAEASAEPELKRKTKTGQGA
jgi:hypothetical protein